MIGLRFTELRPDRVEERITSPLTLADDLQVCRFAQRSALDC